MIKPGGTKDETSRLRALREVELLDTEREERFDRIVRIAQALFDVPIVAVSLVDKDRQWFKASIGLDVCETPRDISFCGHAILQERTFVIPNALKDERFFDNPLVAGDANIRFYAGQPVHGPRGQPLGTLCIIDREAREFDDTKERLLEDLARLVESEINRESLLRAYAAVRTEGNTLRELLDVDEHMIQSVDQDGKFLFVNRQWMERLGYDFEQLQRISAFTVISPDDRDKCKAILRALVPGGPPKAVRTSLVTSDGDFVRVSGTVSCMRDADGSWITRSIFRDVTGQVDTLAALKHSYEQFDDVAAALTDVFWVTDATEHTVLYVSPAYESLWGRTREHIYATPWDWVESIHPDDRERAAAAFSQSIEHNVPFDIEFRIMRPDGSLRSIHDRGEPIVDRDGKVIRIAGVATDISKRTELERTLRELAETDELTRLPTRRFFLQAIDRVLARAQRDLAPISMAVIDLDYFKQINDSYGHATGDEALRLVADTLRAHVRTSDVPARLGGDEFCLLLDGAELDEARGVMQRFSDSLRTKALRNAQTGTEGATLSCSIGLAQWTGAESGTELRERADQALYEAKRSGRGCVAVIPPIASAGAWSSETTTGAG